METRLPALVVLVAAFLAGGYPGSVSSYLAAAVWLGIALAAAWRPPPVPSGAVLGLVALSLLTLVSALWGRSGEVLHVVPLPALYAGLLYATEWAGPRSVDALRPAIAIVAAAGIAGRATGLAAPSHEPGSVRLAWPIGYANGLGLLCALGVILCARRRWWPAAALCAVALGWTLSRSAIVACIAGLVLVVLPRRAALAGAVVLAIAAVFIARPVYQHFQSPAPDTRNVSRLATVSGHGRTRLWRAALREGAHQPVAGGGAGSWRREAGARDLPANAHSLELETFAELGVLGLLALGAFLAVRPRRSAAYAAFAAWALVSAIDWDWQLPAVTGAAVICAGSLTRTGRRLPHGLAVAALALVAGIALLADTVLGYA
jgi:O-antigen ligase